MVLVSPNGTIRIINRDRDARGVRTLDTKTKMVTIQVTQGWHPNDLSQAYGHVDNENGVTYLIDHPYGAGEHRMVKIDEQIRSRTLTRSNAPLADGAASSPSARPLLDQPRFAPLPSAQWYVNVGGNEPDGLWVTDQGNRRLVHLRANQPARLVSIAHLDPSNGELGNMPSMQAVRPSSLGFPITGLSFGRATRPK